MGHTRDSFWLFRDLLLGLLIRKFDWGSGILGLLDSRSRSYFFGGHGIGFEVIDSKPVNIADRYRDCFMIQGRSVLLLYKLHYLYSMDLCTSMTIFLRQNVVSPIT
jgi:hypothetical protein